MNQIYDSDLVKRLTENENRVYNYLLNNKKIIESLKLKEISKNTYTSSATIIRTAKKLGFKGYKELIFSLKENRKYLEYDIDKNFYIKNPEEIENLLHVLNCGKILLYAEGLGDNISHYFYKKLLLLGKNVEHYNSMVFDLSKRAFEAKEYDVLILISRKGKESITFNLAKLLKNLGTKVVVFTSNSNSELYEISDLGIKYIENIDENYENYYPNLFFGYTIIFFEKLLKKCFEKSNKILKKITE